MKAVSRTYNPYPDERLVGIRIAFKLIDLEAASSASVSSNGAEPFSSLPELLTWAAKSQGKIMTMEDDLVRTDGTWEIMPDDLTVPFWSTAVSGAGGTFTANPTLTLQLSKPASSIGFSMQFDDAASCWPSEVSVRAYSGASLLAQKTVENSAAMLVVDMPVTNYNKVVVEFRKTSEPYRRIKLYGFLFGVIQSFDADNVATATFQYGASLDCSAIPSRQMVFTFDNQDKKYNFLNPSGIYKYLQDGQVVEGTIYIGGEPVDMGICYYTKASAADDAMTAQITANDRVIKLDDETYESGASGTWTLPEAARAILGEDAKLDLPADASARIVGKAIPAGTKKREALRLVAQAARTSVWAGRDGTYVFRDLSAGTPVDTLDGDNTESMADVAVTEFCDCVKLTVRDVFAEQPEDQEFTAGEGANVKSYDNPCAVDGQAVADWLLAVNRRRLKYTPRNWGNPAVEIGDTIRIYNAFGQSENTVVTSQTLTYDGGLTAQTEAVGG